jgi:hypothetical protein
MVKELVDLADRGEEAIMRVDMEMGEHMKNQVCGIKNLESCKNSFGIFFEKISIQYPRFLPIKNRSQNELLRSINNKIKFNHSMVLPS